MFDETTDSVKPSYELKLYVNPLQISWKLSTKMSNRWLQVILKVDHLIFCFKIQLYHIFKILVWLQQNGRLFLNITLRKLIQIVSTSSGTKSANPHENKLINIELYQSLKQEKRVFGTGNIYSIINLKTCVYKYANNTLFMQILKRRFVVFIFRQQQVGCDWQQNRKNKKSVTLIINIINRVVLT